MRLVSGEMPAIINERLNMEMTENAKETGPERRRRTHSAEFKAMVVLKSMEGEAGLDDLAREYGLNPNQIKNWRSQMRKHLKVIFADKRGKCKLSVDHRPAFPGCTEPQVR